MSRDINLLHPRLRAVVQQLQKEFPKLLITQTLRTSAEQNALYAQGRTNPGPIVTNVRGPYSQHNWAIAVDFAHNESGNLYPNTFMVQVANRAKQLGLAWGGDWYSFRDTPHLYLPDWGSTPTPLINKFGNLENFKKTWGNESIQHIPSDSEQNTESEAPHMIWLLFTKEGKNAVYFFNGIRVVALTHPDQVTVLNDIYKANTGKSIPSRSYKKLGPWEARLFQVINLKEVKGI